MMEKRSIGWATIIAIAGLILVVISNSCLTEHDVVQSQSVVEIKIVADYVDTWERGGVQCPFSTNDGGLHLTFTLEDDIPSLDIYPGVPCMLLRDDGSQYSIRCRRYVNIEPIGGNFEEFMVRLFDMSPEDPQGIVYWRMDWFQYAECVHFFKVREVMTR